MTIFYVIALFILGKLMFFRQRAKTLDKFTTLSLAEQKVFAFFLVLAGFLSSHSSPLSLLGGTLPLLLIAFLASPRRGLKNHSSHPQLLGATYGTAAHIAVGIASFCFAFILLINGVTALYKTFSYIAAPNRSLLLLSIFLYMLSSSLLSGLRSLVWTQLGLLILFVILATLPLDCLGTILTTPDTVDTLQYIFHTPHSLGFFASLLLVTPMEAQTLWLLEKPKQTRRALLSVLSLALLLAYGLQYYGQQEAYLFSYHTTAIKLVYHLFTLHILLYYAASFLVKDIIQPIYNESLPENKALVMMRSALTILLCIAFGLGYFQLPFSKLLPWIPLLLIPWQVPFWAAFCNIKSNTREFAFTSISSALTYLVLQLLCPSKSWLVYTLSLLVGALLLVAQHYTKYGSIKFVRLSYRQGKAFAQHYITFSKVKKILFAPLYAFSDLRSNIVLHEVPYTLVGILMGFFFVINKMLQYGATVTGSTHLSYLTNIGFLLTLGLLFYPLWHSTLVRFFYAYWTITLTYNLSFCGIVNYLALSQSVYALFNLSAIFFLLARVVPGYSFFWLHIFGLVTGGLYYHYFFPESDLSAMFSLESHATYLFIYAFIVPLIISYFFLKSRHYKLDYTQRALSYLSQEYLHLNSNVVGLAVSPATRIDWLIKAAAENSSAEEKKKGKLTLDAETHAEVKECITDVKKYLEQGKEVVRRRSLYFSPVKKEEFSQHSALACVESALKTFRELDTSFATLPILKQKDDFSFYGSDQHLEQVVYSLVATAFARSEEAVENEILVGDNKIVYQYFGKSISRKERPYIFTYLSHTEQPSGYYAEMGALPYVKRVMEAFNGDVICYCNSDKDPKKRYTRFTLTFPPTGTNTTD